MLIRDIALLDQDYQVRMHQNIWIQDKTITYIGRDIPEAAKDDTVYHGSGKAAIPGFYNMHCHVPMTLLRGYGEGLPLKRWLEEKIFPYEATFTPEDLYWGSLLGIGEMLASGTVSFTDMYLHTDRVYDAVNESRIKANLSSSAQDSVHSTLHYRELPAYERTKYLLERVHTQGHDRIHAEASVHSEYTTTEQMIREAGEFAADNGLSMHIHLSETENERMECLARHGVSPAVWFDRLGIFELPTTAAHCVWLDDADMRILADKKVTAVHCPSSNLKLGSGIAAVPDMMAHGILVAVGTDGAASNNNLDMLEEATLASLLQKGSSRDPLAGSIDAMFESLCANGAAAQERAQCGRLAEGFRADLAVIDLDRPHLQPVYDLRANILYAARSSDIVLTMADGEILYQDGEYRTIDMEQVKWQVKRIAARSGKYIMG